MTDSRRSSSSTSLPAGTPATAVPRCSGAGTVFVTDRMDPGRRPSSRVSITSGCRGSRRCPVAVTTVLTNGERLAGRQTSACDGTSLPSERGVRPIAGQVVGEGRLDRPGGLVQVERLGRRLLAPERLAEPDAGGHGHADLTVRVRELLLLGGVAQLAQLVAATADGGEGVLEQRLEAGQGRVDVVVGLGAHAGDV